MAKSPEAFRTISEVAEWLDTPAHVLRFWESRFPEVSPVKRAGGRRYYRPEDMRLLGGIKHLLHTEGHTIKSVQERLKSDGTSAISALSPPLAAEADASAEDVADKPGAETEAAWDGEVLQADIAAVGGAVTARRQGVDALMTAPADEAEVPPIGFFFDDSDDAAPAEDQTGTFAAPVSEPTGRQESDDDSGDTAPPETEAAAPAVDAEIAGAAAERPETPDPDAPDIMAGPGSEAGSGTLPPPHDEYAIADRAQFAVEPEPDNRGADGEAEPPPSAQEAAEPGQVLPEDPDDSDRSGIAPISPAADLRSLTRRDLPPGWRARLPGIVARLERLLEGAR